MFCVASIDIPTPGSNINPVPNPIISANIVVIKKYVKVLQNGEDKKIVTKNHSNKEK